MAKRIGRAPVEVKITAPSDGHVPIFDGQTRLWNTVSTSSLSASTASFAVSAATASSADNFTVRGTLTAQTIVVQVITSSTELVTGSLTVNGSLNALGGVTGSLLGTSSFALSASRVVNADTASGILGGEPTYVPFFNTHTTLRPSSIYQVYNNFSTTSIAINQNNINADFPEALYVFQAIPTSVNTISANGNINSYLQSNIQNNNQGVSASSDIVATANNGNEISNYVNLGINSENYAAGFVGGPNDAYVYSLANNLHIGNVANNGTYLSLFVGGGNVDANTKLRLNPNNRHQMTGSLDISGSLIVRSGITGSLFGTASWANNAITSSQAISALSASYSQNALSSSYAASASLAQNAITSSRALSGNGDFTGSFSGSFVGNGAGITNISASSVVGLNLSAITSGSVTASVDPAYGLRVNSNTQISGSTRITGSLSVTGSINISGSTGAVFSANVDNINFTGSFLQKGSISLDGVLSVTGSITSSLFGTASWANNAVTASNALTASYVLNAVSASFSISSSQAISASFALSASQAITSSFAFSASQAITASFALNAPSSSISVSSSQAISASYASTADSASQATTASFAFNAISASRAITASHALTASSADDFLVRGTLTAQTIVAQVITSSTDFVTGSTRFGTQLFNTHQFTGSVSVTGSLIVYGGKLTGDLEGTASWSNNAVTSSYSLVSNSASYAESSSFSLFAVSASQSVTSSHAVSAMSSSNALTASYVLEAVSSSFSQFSISSSYAESASYAVSSSFSISASQSITSSHAVNALSSSYAVSSSLSLNSLTASYVLNAVSSSFASSGNGNFTGSFTGSFVGEISGSLFGTASWANNANTASYVLNAVSASFANTASNILGGTANYIPIWNDTITLSSSIIYQTGGNIGIGTISPTKKLEVFGGNDNVYVYSTNTAQTPGVVIANNDISNYTNAYFTKIYNSTAAVPFLFGKNPRNYVTSVAYGSSNNGLIIGTYGDKHLILGTNNTERLRINSGSGEVYITGSLIVSQDITGSLFGTASNSVSASRAATSLSSSYALSASYSVSSSHAVSSSYAVSSSQAIFAQTASTAQDARDILVYAKNVTGTQINKGSVVRISGATGDNPHIALADWTNDTNSANTLGLVTSNIPNDGFGFVLTEGLFLGYDTETPGWVPGQLVYLASSGSITGSAPTSPLHEVRLGQVLRIQQNNGSIYVRVDNGYELGELHDVLDTTTTSSYGDLLVRSGSVWTNSRHLTGSYDITGSLSATSFTGSLFGTASNAITSSFSVSASRAISSSRAITAETSSLALNAVTASFASSIANNLNITASNVLINNSLTVSGTASFAYIQSVTGSAVIIGQEYVVLNTQTPASRFAGFLVYDSGSNSTSSIVWDSLRDHFVYSKSSGSTYAGGMFIAGPKNTGSLGSEDTLTQFFVPVSQGDDHIQDSQIYSSGSVTIVTGSLRATLGFTGSLFGTASQAVSSSLTVSASHASNSNTSSYGFFAISSSFSSTSSLALRGIVTASVVGSTLTFTKGDNSTFDVTILAGTATTASYVSSSNVDGPLGKNSVLSASFALTASFVPGVINNNQTGSLSVLSSSYAVSSSFSVSSSQAISASFSVNSVSASYLSGSTAIVNNLTSSLDASIRNVRIGRGLLPNNIVIGSGSLLATASISGFTGGENTVLGDLSLQGLGVGDGNTAVGYSALQRHTGSYSTAVGSYALANVFGGRNSAFGQASLYLLVSGTGNAAFGDSSMFYTTNGSNNTAIGNATLRELRFGDSNTAVGAGAIYIGFLSGSSNTVVGFNTGNGIVTGSANTILGANVTGLPSTLNNNIILSDGQGNIRARYSSSLWTLSDSTLGNFTGSLQGTSSWANNATTASYALNSVSSSFSSTSSLTLRGIITASAAGSTITFTKGDNSAFSVTLDTATAATASYILSSNVDGPLGKNSVLSSSYSVSSSLAQSALTASFVLNAISASYALSASLAQSALTASYVLNAVSASQAQNANTASYVLNAVSASFATLAQNANTASYVLNAVSASFATSASRAITSLSSSFASNSNTSSFALTASSADDFTVRGTLTAQTIVAQVITSSTDFVTGSTRFGTLLSNTHTFTGSVSITGSLTVVGAEITGSIFGTSSWANNAISSSFSTQAANATTASFALFATSASLSQNAITSSYVLNAISSSFSSTSSLPLRGIITASAVGSTITFTKGDNSTFDVSLTTATAATASYVLSSNVDGPIGKNSVLSSSFALSSSQAITASYVLNAVSASFATSASQAQNAISSSYPLRVLGTDSIVSYNTSPSTVIPPVDSIILGKNAGSFSRLSSSVLIGQSAGSDQIGQILSSVFIGTRAGDAASLSPNKADYSNFIGYEVGTLAYSASYCNLIGYRVGYRAGATGNIGPNNIIIGTNITLGNNVRDSINIGGLLFGTGSYFETSGNPFSGSSNGRIGINQPLPLFSLDVSGSGRFTNGLQITGSLNAPIITGSLFGTSSWSSNSITASYVLNAVSASVSSTASYVLNAVSASFVTSASFAATSSFSNNFTVANQLTIDGTLTDYATVLSSIIGSNNVFTQATSSFTSAFFKYTIATGSNSRAGEVVAVWNGTNVQFYDNSTVDIGNTQAVTSSVSIVGGDVQFNFQTNTSGWRIKSMATFI